MSSETGELDDETLVAYLDGELPAEESDRVRDRISQDAEVRLRVEQLQASWNMLDQLPVPAPNPQLAQTTIELITKGLVQSEQVSVVQRFKQYRWYALAAISAATVLVGAWISSANHRGLQQAVVNDLFLLTHIRELESVDSDQWLQMLGSLNNLERAGLPLYSTTGFPELPVRGREFKAWVDKLDINQIQTLQTAFRNFNASEPDHQQELRALARRLSEPKEQELFSRVKAYFGLLNKIGTTEAYQIAGEKDLEARKDQINQVIHRELAINYTLSDEEKSHIVHWCDRLKARSFYFLNADDPDLEIIRLLDIESPDANIQAEDLERLIQNIDQRGRELLDSLEPSLQTKVLKLWVYNSLPTTRPRKQYSSTELLERFRKFPSQRQNQLIYLPSSEVIKTLSQDELESTNSNGKP